ncbi:hypothetical protein MTR67_038588 [Solanum verrucosum]|uniref:Uncharacterized protein n=1 Tax=Solanum verrucosum TaxID=315347 RepID=A0AAF0UFH1_SOLVR|nr:hypothetical protein MTR67_038588 [Solanum verrucosum]
MFESHINNVYENTYGTKEKIPEERVVADAELKGIVEHEVELVGNIAATILRLHLHQLISTVSTKPLVSHLANIVPPKAKHRKSKISSECRPFYNGSFLVVSLIEDRRVFKASVDDSIQEMKDFIHSFGESDVLFPGRIYFHPQWSNITNSLLSQHHGEQSECKSNTNARKVFGESSDWHKDAHYLDTSNKHIEIFILPNDLVSSVSKVNSCGGDVKNEDKNDEEEIVSIRNKPIELVIANADKHSF